MDGYNFYYEARAKVNVFFTRTKANNIITPGPKVIKLFSVLNSVEHEILNAHKYKKYQEIQLFEA